MSLTLQQTLNGIRVLESGASHSVKVAGMILRDCGADVVRLEDDSYSNLFSATDRSKNILNNFDVNRTEDVVSLLKRVDIVIDDNTNPEFTKKVTETSKKFSHIIYCAVPSSLSIYENTAQYNEDALSAAVGLYETPSGLGGPRPFSLQLASTVSAFHAVNAIAMALVGRERNGYGYNVTVPLEKTTLSFQILVAMIRSRPPYRWEPFRWLSSPFMGVWKTSDANYVYIHIGMPRHLRNFMFLLDSAGFVQEKKELKQALHKETRYEPMMVSGVKESLAILRILRVLFRKRTADFWEQLLGEAGLCCAKVRKFDEWKNHSQVIESKEIVSIPDNTGKSYFIPGKIMDFSPEDSIALLNGKNVTTEQVLEMWDEKECKRVDQSKTVLPLEGVRVLDLSRIIAGPFSGRLLAEYGADVVHVSVRGSQLIWEEPFHIAFNCGKKSVSVDCSRPGGRKELADVIKKIKPDIVVHNFLDDAAKKLGIDYESLKEINPEIIHVGIKGYNPNGPWKQRPGFEQCVQAASGILSAYSNGIAPQILPVPVIDLCTGIISSFATSLCYLQKLKGNGGKSVSTNLTIPAIYLQLKDLNSKEHVKPSALSGYYRAKDRLFYLSVQPGRESHLEKIPGLSFISSDKSTPANNLQSVFRKKKFSYWLSCIRNASLGNEIQIVPRVPMTSILKAELHKTDGLFKYKDHEKFGSVLVCKTPVSMQPEGIAVITEAEPMGKSNNSFVSSDFNPYKKSSTDLKSKRSVLNHVRWIIRQSKWVIVIIWRELKLKK